MENSRIKNTSAMIDRILKIVQGFLIAGIILCAVFIPLVAIFGEKMVADASRLDLGYVQLKLLGDASGYLDNGKLKFCVIMTMVSAIVALAAGWYCIRVLREILVPMKQGKPFAEGISGKIRKLGFTVLFGGALVEIGRIASELFTVRAYRLEEIISSPIVGSVNVSASSAVHIWFIFVTAHILFFLSYVFRSGEALQRESDETL